MEQGSAKTTGFGGWLAALMAAIIGPVVVYWLTERWPSSAQQPAPAPATTIAPAAPVVQAPPMVLAPQPTRAPVQTAALPSQPRRSISGLYSGTQGMEVFGPQGRMQSHSNISLDIGAVKADGTFVAKFTIFPVSAPSVSNQVRGQIIGDTVSFSAQDADGGLFFDGTVAGNAIRGSYRVTGRAAHELADMFRRNGFSGFNTTTIDVYK